MNVNSVSLKGSERVRESDGASPDTGRTQAPAAKLQKQSQKGSKPSGTVLGIVQDTQSAMEMSMARDIAVRFNSLGDHRPVP